MTSNAETVMGMYEAFGRGDVGHILAEMSDEVAWDHGLRETGLPYLQPATGKEAVAGFFRALTENLEFTTFEPAALCVSDDTVMVAVREIGRNIVTGAPPRGGPLGPHLDLRTRRQGGGLPSRLRRRPARGGGPRGRHVDHDVRRNR